jgi:excisionase family DNA binding protein
MEQKLYSVAELVEILKLHPKTILRFIHEGKIKARKIGRTWMVGTQELKEYAHAEFAETDATAAAPRDKPDYGSLSERISVSAVVEIDEQNSEEASRISNSLMAMLNGKDESWGKTRFDFFYYPEIRKAKYLIYGSPKFISAILNTFDLICAQKE